MTKQKFYETLKGYFTDEEVERLNERAIEIAHDIDRMIPIARDVLMSYMHDTISTEDFNAEFGDILEREITESEFEELQEL